MLHLKSQGTNGGKIEMFLIDYISHCCLRSQCGAEAECAHLHICLMYCGAFYM